MKFFLLFLFLVAIPSRSIPQDINHFEENLGWVEQATTIDIMNQRISSAAREYQMYAPIPRGAFYDLALPADSVEYDSLKGHALLLIYCVLQDSVEIPPVRLYVVNDDIACDLNHVLTLKFEIPDSCEIIVKVFGKYRSDSIYLLPISLRKPGSELFMDFAANRKDFRITVFGDDIPLKYKPVVKYSLTDKPEPANVLKFILREFPSIMFIK
jgi:hypothetical protein